MKRHEVCQRTGLTVKTVRFYESTPGNRVMEIPGSAEIEQTIDLKEMFR